MANHPYDIEALKFQHASTVEELMWSHAMFNPQCNPSAVQYAGTLSHIIRLNDGRFCRIFTDIATGDTQVSGWERAKA